MKNFLLIILAIILPLSIISCDKEKSFSLNKISRYETGIFYEGAMEIPAYDKNTKKLFVTNDYESSVDVIDLTNINKPIKLGSINVSGIGKGVTSVAVRNGILVIAVNAKHDNQNGKVLIYNTENDFSKNAFPIADYTVGVLPDMVGISPDGKKICTANEGEPGEDQDGNECDPEGSISIIDFVEEISIENVSFGDVTTIDFKSYDSQKDQLLAKGVRIFPGIDVSKDLEPEYLTFDKNSSKIWVSLQEQNSFAIIDLITKEIIDIKSFGYKNHNHIGNGLDAAEDGLININNWPVLGMYMPDTIASFSIKGKNYIITANEGDDRGEDINVADLILDPITFPNYESLIQSSAIGDLAVSSIYGDTDNDGDYDNLYSYGTRSFSIWNEKGDLLWDSGDQFEQKVSEISPDYFNIGLKIKKGKFKDLEKDARSGNSGPEPEGVAIGKVEGKTLVFIGLEKQGGIMMYDVSNPKSPEFIQYIESRNYNSEIQLNGEIYNEQGTPAEFIESDLNPEGIIFVSKKDSPINKPLLIVAYEKSGSVVIYEIDTI